MPKQGDRFVLVHGSGLPQGGINVCPFIDRETAEGALADAWNWCWYDHGDWRPRSDTWYIVIEDDLEFRIIGGSEWVPEMGAYEAYGPAGRDNATARRDLLNSGLVQYVPVHHGKPSGPWYIIVRHPKGMSPAKQADDRWNGRCTKCGRGTYTGFTSIEHEGGPC